MTFGGGGLGLAMIQPVYICLKGDKIKCFKNKDTMYVNKDLYMTLYKCTCVQGRLYKVFFFETSFINMYV